MNWSPGHLSSWFGAAAAKRLAPTECDPAVSHGHEFQGIRAIVEMFGKPEGNNKLTFSTRYFYLNDETKLSDTGTLTLYDSRWNNPNRSAEYRLYYSGNSVTDSMKAGDVLIIARDLSYGALVIVAGEDSAVLSDLLWLFGIRQDLSERRFSTVNSDSLATRELTPDSLWLLETLGIRTSTCTDYLDEMRSRFGHDFPSTDVFSAYARSKSNYPDARDGSADEVLYDWYNTEEYLFSIFEASLLEERIAQGFTPKSFLEYALRVMNRRKSRAGQGLENHLAQLFNERGILHSRTACTEGKSRPDFLFPGIDCYRKSDFPEELLHMLGVKTSCKDRWRQVLVEADRISRKHLLTMQKAISPNQTAEMQKRSLRLVLPEAIHTSYTLEQQAWLMKVEDFIQLLKDTQSRAAMRGFLTL